jgi:hypothetical protein
VGFIDRKLLEVTLHLKNVGSSTLVVTNLRVDLRYADCFSSPILSIDPTNNLFGRLYFPKSLLKDDLTTPQSLEVLKSTEQQILIKSIRERARKGDRVRQVLLTSGRTLKAYMEQYMSGSGVQCPRFQQHQQIHFSGCTMLMLIGFGISGNKAIPVKIHASLEWPMLEAQMLLVMCMPD